MTQTPPTSTTATHHDARPPQPPRPTFGEMLTEVVDLGGGLAAGLLPLLLLSVPGIILFVVLPAILLLALALPFALIGTVVAVPPYLLARRRRRRQQRGARTGSRAAGHRPHAAAG